MKNTLVKTELDTSWDDGSLDDLKVANLLEKYELPGTFYIPVNWQQYNIDRGFKPLSQKDVQYLANRFEIGSHTINHPHLTKIPIELAKIEIIESRKALEDLIGKPVTKFCYPRGYANDEIREIVRDNYDIGRTTEVGAFSGDDPAWTPTTVHVYDRQEYGNFTWFSYAKLKHREWLRKGGTYHIWGHGWEISKFDNWYMLEQLFKLITL